MQTLESLLRARSEPFALPGGLRNLRAERPLHRITYPDGHVGWLVTAYRPARAVLGDSRFSVAVDRLPVGQPEKLNALRDSLRETLTGCHDHF
jgi:hypothetical protein